MAYLYLLPFSEVTAFVLYRHVWLESDTDWLETGAFDHVFQMEAEELSLQTSI